MKLTLPLPPNRANARWHWRTEKQKKDDYYFLCECQTVWRHRPDFPLKRARIAVTLYTWSAMDLDNLMARLKWPVDWLVRRGYIADDSPDVLEWELPRQEIDRRRPRIEIELVEITEDEAA